eukprot:764512-Hanusia_phi.AAC.2
MQQLFSSVQTFLASTTSADNFFVLELRSDRILSLASPTSFVVLVFARLLPSPSSSPFLSLP